MSNPNFDSVLSQTLHNYRDNLADAIFAELTLLKWLRDKKRQKELDGGVKIIVGLKYAKNSTVKSYSGYEPLDVTPQEGVTSAEYEWKQVAGSISISRLEERQNSTSRRIMNMLTSKIEILQMSLTEALGEMIFGDGTGNDGKDILGLQAIISSTPTTGTLGGIDRATNSWWRNRAQVGTKDSAAFDNLLSLMENMYNTCSRGTGGAPDYIVTDQVSYEGYNGTLTDQKRFRSSDADASFEHLMFKGSVVTWDEKAPSTSTKGNMYFINSKYLEWTVDEKSDFISTPFVRPENQDAKVAQVLFMGNLVVSNCRKLGVIHDIDLA